MYYFHFLCNDEVLVADGKKVGGHTATPHPAKKAGKAPATPATDKSKAQTPKTGGSISCKSCSKYDNNQDFESCYCTSKYLVYHMVDRCLISGFVNAGVLALIKHSSLTQRQSMVEENGEKETMHLDRESCGFIFLQVMCEILAWSEKLLVASWRSFRHINVMFFSFL